MGSKSLIKSESYTEISELGIDLDGCKQIICHPNNYDFLVKELEQWSPTVSDFIHMPKSINIIKNEYMPEWELACKKDGTPIWERASVLPDDNFTTWIDDLENPPSWAIYFGLVQQAKSRVYYTVNMGQTWSFNNKPASERVNKPRRISNSQKMLEFVEQIKKIVPNWEDIL